MIKKIFYLIVVLQIFNTIHYASNKIDYAEELYKKKQYSQALSIYLAESKKSGLNSSLMYNIGNCYFQLDEIGEAISYYKRALKLTPLDKELIENLEVAQSRIVTKLSDSKKETIQINKILNILPFNTYIWFIMGVWFCFNGFFLSRSLNINNEIIKNAFYVSLTFLILSSLLLGLKVRSEFFIKEGVLVSKKVSVKSGPSSSLSTVFFIHEGTSFRINKQLNDWVEIKLDNGYSGWINKKDFWRI